MFQLDGSREGKIKGSNTSEDLRFFCFALNNKGGDVYFQTVGRFGWLPSMESNILAESCAV